MIGCEDRLRNDLYCVDWGVKLYSNQPILLKLKDKMHFRSELCPDHVLSGACIAQHTNPLNGFDEAASALREGVAQKEERNEHREVRKMESRDFHPEKK